MTACVVGLATGYSVFVAIAFGLFVTPLAEAFGWTRTEISFAFTICTFAIVLLSPTIGAWIDRRGVRRVVVPSIGIFGVSLGLLALQTGSLWVLYGLYALVALVGAATLPAGYSRVVVSWFTARRGLALSVALSGVGLSATVMPPLIERIIEHAGWRVAYLTLGAVCILISWPILALWLKENPAEGSATGARPAVPHDWSSRALWRDPVFARVGVAALLLGFSVGGVMVHLVPFLTHRLGSAQQAAYAYSLLGLSTLVSRIGCGYLLDRIAATRVALAVFLVSGLGIAWLALDSGPATVPVAILLLGIGFGADFDVISYLVSRYFPVEQFTRTYGLIYSVFLIGLGTGSAATGTAYDLTGGYTGAFLALAVALSLCGLLFNTLGPYRQALTRS